MDENNKINGNVLKFTAIFIAMFVMFLLGCVVFGELFAVICVFVLCPGVYFLRNYKKANGFARIKERILNKFENERKCQIIVAILMVGCITGIWAVTYEEPIDEAKRLNNTYIIPNVEARKPVDKWPRVVVQGNVSSINKGYVPYGGEFDSKYTKHLVMGNLDMPQSLKLNLKI